MIDHTAMLRAALSFLLLLPLLSVANVASASQQIAGQIATVALGASWAESEMTVIDRPAFVMRYPSDWKVATDQMDFNADKQFTINVAGADSYITIKIFTPEPGIDADDLMFSILTTLDGPMIDTLSRDSFENWGKIKGEGTHLKGKIAGFLPGGARLFVSTQNGKGILVTELYYSDDLNTAMPGFDLIRESFNFK